MVKPNVEAKDLIATGSIAVTSSNQPPTYIIGQHAITVEGTTVAIVLAESDQPANAKAWALYGSGGALSIGCFNDAGGLNGAAIAFLRSGGNPSGVRFTVEIELDGALNHDGTTIGFFGVTPTTRQTELTDELTSITHTNPGTPDYAIQALSAGGFGFVTADEGHTVLSVVKNLQTRVNELETKLTAYGLLQDAD